MKDSFITKSYHDTHIHSCYDRSRGSFVHQSPYLGSKEYKSLGYVKTLIRTRKAKDKGRTLCAECGCGLLGGECYTIGCSKGL